MPSRSPDGNYIIMCGGWEGSSASVDMYQFTGSSWTRIWQKTTSTSCASVDFSSDSTQVAVGMYWYQTDGNTAYVYQVDTGSQVDSVSGPRPGGCSSGNNNNCGTVYGISWSPDNTRIVTAHGRNDEGVYYWFADIDEDNDGYNTTDQGDGIVDAFPTDGTQWIDTDGDGYGDNSDLIAGDQCPYEWGSSWRDRFGCLDSDGDGASDPSAIGLLRTKSNGLMQITMATVTIICSILPQINSTSINEEMPSLMTPHNGTTQMVMAGAITTKMRLGILTEPPNGLV